MDSIGKIFDKILFQNYTIDGVEKKLIDINCKRE